MSSRKISVSKSVSKMSHNNILTIVGIILLILIVVYFLYLENKKEKESFTTTYRAIYGSNDNGNIGGQTISSSNSKVGRVGLSNNDNSKGVGCRGLKVQGYNSYGKGCCMGYNNEEGITKGKCCVSVNDNKDCVQFEGNY